MNPSDIPDTPMHIVLPQMMHMYFMRVYRLLEGAEIHPAQVSLLMMLSGKDGMSQKELVTQLKVRPPTVTVMLQRMERAGFVERRQDEKDQRMSRIYMTEKGNQTIQEIDGVMLKLEEELYKGFSNEEILLMKRFFMQIWKNLSAMHEEMQPSRSRRPPPHCHEHDQMHMESVDAHEADHHNERKDDSRI